MTSIRSQFVALAGVSVILLGACDDPSKGKAKALTAEATSSSLESSGSPSAARYAFDATTSKVEWVGSKVTGKHEGGFRQFRGAVTLPDNAIEKGSVTVDIDTASLYTDSEKLAGHLKTGDFFDVEKFPKATFASTVVKKGGDRGATHTVTGNLTLHGVTKSITFPANLRPGQAGVDVDAEFAINRKDFGLVYAGKPDDLIREDVVIKLTIRPHKRT